VSGGFLVDVAALDQLITTLSEAAQRMHTANDRLRAASAADLGGGDLDHAAAGFQDRWEYGIGKISHASEQLTDSLRQARDLYEQTDQAIAGLFPDPGTGAAAGPAGPETLSPISRALDAGVPR
jgi:uncharacterized protein YukE